MSDVQSIPVFTTPSPAVRLIGARRPWIWLRKGMEDMRAAWRVSLAYGAIVVAFSWALTLVMAGTGLFYMLVPMGAGFLLVAPLAAVGLYETSRRLAAGEPVSLRHAVMAVRTNPLQVALMGAILLLIQMVWLRVAVLLFAVFFNGMNPSFDTLLSVLFTSDVSLPFLVTGTILGGVLALVAFMATAVSVPMLLDREANIFVAIATSVTAVRLNWKPMLHWAFLIVVFTGLGFATLFLGLAVALPLIGHATWHAYKDLVE